MSTARNQLIAASDHIRTLRIVIAVLLLFVIAQWLRNGVLQETRRLYVPPDLTQGAMVAFDQVPPPVVYTFASYIFQQLNRWKEDGEQDYQQQIYTLQGFFTPGCLAYLEADMNNKSRLGELRNRVRSIEEIANKGYSRQRVSILSSERWVVWVDFTIRETINGHPVKHIQVRYELPVEKFDVDKEVNPWGLAIACDNTIQPTLLNEAMLNQPFSRQESITP